LGYFWAEKNENLDQAEVLIRQALEEDPNNGSYLDSLGWVHFRRGQFAEALIVLLRAAEALAQPSPVVFDHLAQTYLALGRSPEALLFWQKSLQLDPGNQLVQQRIEEITVRQARTITPSSAKADSP
jgi:tetratricopeptide (TPR) repeat protein